ncbi:MAG: peptidoglycan editing factor PgeF [Alphaproteobacteria bacterium]|nr:peptidoglycan editing factor PgeF [Alphaproteobacteria bacterium]
MSFLDADPTDILFASNLNALENVRHAFFGRSWGRAGLSPLQDEPDSAPWRERIGSFFGVPSPQVLCCRQVHSPTVVYVSEPWSFREAPAADGMVTDRPGLVLGIMTADCAPVLLADAEAGVIGAAHAGWRGALGGILGNVLEAMEKRGARRKNIVAALGPCIAQESYEVDKSFSVPFFAQNSGNELFFKQSIKKDKYLFDLSGYIVSQLNVFGVGNVLPSLGDTYADPKRFFSHRYATQRHKAREGSLVSGLSMH